MPIFVINRQQNNDRVTRPSVLTGGVPELPWRGYGLSRTSENTLLHDA